MITTVRKSMLFTLSSVKIDSVHLNMYVLKPYKCKHILGTFTNEN